MTWSPEAPGRFHGQLRRFRRGRQLEPAAAARYRHVNTEHPMLALYIIVGFVVVLGAINFIEFGRVD